jgi:hypothetical protein
MNRNYFIKEGSKASIFLQVLVSTQGSADTFVNKRRSGGSVELLAESPKHDGIIKRQTIAKANELTASVITITTMINLANVPKQHWQAAFDNLLIDYIIEGGADGKQEFEYDKDDKVKNKSGQIIVVEKAIKIITI